MFGFFRRPHFAAPRLDANGLGDRFDRAGSVTGNKLDAVPETPQRRNRLPRVVSGSVFESEICLSAFFSNNPNAEIL